MKTKQLFIALFLILLTTYSFAQARFGLKAGLSLAGVHIDGLVSPDTETLPTFHLGGFLDYSVNEFFVIQPGLQISGKGFKYNETILGTSIKAEARPIYIDIPVFFLLRKDVGGVKLFGGAGPYLGFGIAGNYKFSGAGQTEDGDIDWGSDEDSDDLKRGDLGLILGGGLELDNGLIFSLNYHFGLNNTDPAGSSDFKQMNRVFGVSMGYLFGKK